jgi:putative lipoic acid-binding regulatory protein
MPYIKQERRPAFEQAIKNVVEELGAQPGNDTMDDSAKGELNYVIYSIVKRYVEQRGMRYHRLQDFINGTLMSCRDELSRRLMSSYEDGAIEKNGDVA